MISYKTQKADLENKKGLFFEIGLVFSLLAIFFALQTKRPTRAPELNFDRSEMKVIQEEIINTFQTPPPPPPSHTPMQQITMLTIVKNDAEDASSIDIRADVDQKTVIPEYVPIERPQEEEAVQEQEIFLVVEEQPSFPGGDAARMKYFAENIHYPVEAREAGIQGTVYVGFVVEPDGSVSNVKVLRGIGGGCDEEALRVVSQMPKWNPGKQRNQPVRVQFTLPVRFTLM